MRMNLLLGLLIIAYVFTPAFAQSSDVESQAPYKGYTEYFQDEDLIIMFVAVSVSAAALFLFLFRESIFVKKKQERTFVSDADRDYDKYHSDWGGEDSESLGNRKSKKYEDEYREAFLNSRLPDYYKILGVEKDATPDEIKNRFRKLVKELHPDKTKDQTEDLMSGINKAYEVLSDSEKRRSYDKYLNR